MTDETPKETKAHTAWMGESDGVSVEGPNGGGWFKIAKGDEEFTEQGEEDAKAKAEELRKAPDTAWMQEANGVKVEGPNGGGWFMLVKGDEEFNEHGAEDAKAKAKELRTSSEKREKETPDSDLKSGKGWKAAQSTISGMPERTPKAAYEMGKKSFSDAGSFVDAVVESSKILAHGMQDMGRETISEGRSEFETLTAEVKEMAAVKSPNEFFQLQFAMMRRNFNKAFANSTRHTEAMIKLSNEAAQPITNRVRSTVEKVRDV